MNVPYQVKFNNYLLQNASFRTQDIKHTNTPGRDIQTEARARNNGYIVVNSQYTSKTITVVGQMAASDRPSLVALIDAMKLNLNGVSGNLDIDYGNDIRRYFATVSSIDIDEEYYNINFAPYTITFECADPFGYSTISGVANLPGQTSLLKDVIMTVSGSINADPILFITINSGTANMSILKFSNETTGELIVITKPNAAPFVQNDQLIINCKLKQVMINGSGIDYTGRFPTMNPPTAQLRVAITATTAKYGILINYLPSFL